MLQPTKDLTIIDKTVWMVDVAISADNRIEERENSEIQRSVNKSSMIVEKSKDCNINRETEPEYK